MEFKEIKASELGKDPFTMISKQWMLVTTGDVEKYNTMTASWGGFGYIWNKEVATIYIRPSRYTKELLDSNATFSLSFLPETYRTALNLCGTISGRDEDKFEKAGLHLAIYEDVPYVEEAETVFLCKKMYVQDMDPKGMLIDKEKFYPEGDYHCIYIAEIEKVLKK